MNRRETIFDEVKKAWIKTFDGIKKLSASAH